MLLLGSWLGAKLGAGVSSGWGDIIGAVFGSVLAYSIGFVGVCGWWHGACTFHIACGAASSGRSWDLCLFFCWQSRCDSTRIRV
jgi:hypothetical protein